jgi:hypothetical protein
MTDAAGDSQTSYFSSDAPRAAKPPYVLVAQAEAQAFSAAVSELIAKQGYQPQGGVFVAMAGKGPVFCQALVLGAQG